MMCVKNVNISDVLTFFYLYISVVTILLRAYHFQTHPCGDLPGLGSQLVLNDQGNVLLACLIISAWIKIVINYLNNSE